MKKIIFIVVLMISVIFACSSVYAAQTGTCGTNVSWTLDDSGTLIISGSGHMTNYAGNGAPWNSGKDSIKEVIIENGVTSVGNAAFINCTNLEIVTMPDSVTAIGSNSFQACTSLAEIKLSTGLMSIGAAAFSGCSGLTGIEIPANVTSIGNWAFNSCTSLSNIVWKAQNVSNLSTSVVAFGNVGKDTSGVTVSFEYGIEKVPAYAFYGSDYISNVVLADSITEIGAYAFYSCDNLSDIKMSAFIKTIGNQAFDDSGLSVGFCGTNIVWILADGTLTISGTGEILSYAETNVPWYPERDTVKTLIIEEGITAIGNSAFYKCTNLTSVSLPETLTSIGKSAFSYCSSLSDISFPNNLTTIMDAAFSYCYGLCEVTLPPDLTYMANWAFSSCSNITRINWNSKNVADFSNESRPFPNAGNNTDGITLVFGEEVERVPAFAFYGTTNITDIVLPDTIESIGEYAFRFTSVYDDETNWENNCFYIDGFLIDTKGSLGGEFTVKDGTKVIAEYAFSGRTNLTGITIPDSVRKINEYAFYNCSALKSITLPFTGMSRDSNSGYNSVFGYIFGTADEEEATVTQWHSEGVNGYCVPESLTTVVVTDMLELFDGAFNNCIGITNITLGDNTTKMGNAVFSDCAGLTSVSLGEELTQISDWAFHGCDSISSITIPDTITRIGAYAFNECSELSEIILSDSVVSIGECAFDSTAYSNNSENWQGDAFYIGSVLAKVNSTVSGEFLIAENTKHIADAAFADCTQITGVTIPEGLTHIGNHAFYNCDGLTAVSIPDSVISIGDFAFSDCSALADIKIPQSQVSIGNFAFSKCGLKTVEIPENIGYMGNSVFSYCQQLKTVTIPENITDVQYRTFYGCTGLTDIKIINGVTGIGAYAFGNCNGINTLTIPKTVENIETGAFENCSSIKAVKYESSETDWGNIRVDIKNESLIKSKIMYNYKVGDRVIYVDVEISGNTFTVTPNDVENGEEIIFVCYNGDKMSYVKRFAYDGSPYLTFTPDTEFNKVKVLVFDSLDFMIPLCNPNEVTLSK